MEPKRNNFRPASREVSLRELLEGTFVPAEGQEPNHFLLAGQEKVYLVNVMAIVLRKEEQGSLIDLLLDDGTGKIVLRFFEANHFTFSLKVGDALLVIGRPRAFNQEKYLSPETVKKIDPLWLKVRALKWKLLRPDALTKDFSSRGDFESDSGPSIRTTNITTPEKIPEEMVSNGPSYPSRRILEFIRKNDQGQGVSIEEVIENASLPETEQLLKSMMEKGEIFQNSPGRVKPL